MDFLPPLSLLRSGVRGLSRALAAAGIVILLARTSAAQSPGAPGVAVYKKLSLAQLMDVEVTSVSRRPEKLSDTPSAVQVLRGEDVWRSGAMRLPNALRLFSNLAVARVDSRQWAITARGFNNTLANKMLVLMDGRTIYTPLFAGVFWDAHDTFMPDLERIEVISGPGATQWGSNAVNGVINITTKNSRDTQGGLLYAEAGTEVRSSAGVRYGGTLAPNLHYRVYAKHSDFDGSVQPDGRAAGDEWRQSQTGFRADWQPLATDLLTVQGDFYSGRVATPTMGDLRMEGGNLLGRWSRTLAPDAGFKFQAYYDRAFRRVPGSIIEDLETVDLDFQHQIPIGSAHDVVWGLNYREIHDDVQNRAGLTFQPPRVRRSWWSVFLQDEITLPGAAWHLTVGSKFERNPYTGTEVQPNLRLAWKWSPQLLVWGAVSRALRTPSRIDRDLYFPASAPYVIAGGPNFMSEKLEAWEVGVRGQPGADFSYSISAFVHNYDDLRSLEPTGTGSTQVIANGIVGKSYGVEFNADYAVTSRWRLRLGYTEMRVKSRLKPGSLDRTSVRSQSLDPNHQLVVISRVDFSDRWSLDGSVRYVAPLRNQQVPGYTEADARVCWKPNDRWEWSLLGRNLLQAQHREFGTPAAGRDIERSGSLLATWRF